MSIERLRVRGHRVRVRISSEGLRAQCALRHWNGRAWSTARSKSCSAWTVFHYVPSGRYRLRITSSAGTVTRRLLVR